MADIERQAWEKQLREEELTDQEIKALNERLEKDMAAFFMADTPRYEVLDDHDEEG